MSCRLDNTRILATDTLRAECREGGGGGGGCRGMAAVINMRVAAGGGELNHGPARGAARPAGRREVAGGRQRGRSLLAARPALTFLQSILSPAGRAGLGWAGLGWVAAISLCQPASPHSLLLYCQSRPPRPQLCYTICCTRGCGSSAPAAAPPGSPPPQRRRGAIKAASAQCSPPAWSWAEEVNK